MSDVAVHDVVVGRVRTMVSVHHGEATVVSVRVSVDGEVVRQKLVWCFGIQPSAAELGAGGERLVEMLSELVARYHPAIARRSADLTSDDPSCDDRSP